MWTAFGHACDDRSVGCVRSVLGEVCPVTLRGFPDAKPRPAIWSAFHSCIIGAVAGVGSVDGDPG